MTEISNDETYKILLTILQKFEENEKINLSDYYALKNIETNFQKITNIDDNEILNVNNIQLKEIKQINSKIKSFIKDKNPYQFINDYFVKSSNINDEPSNFNILNTNSIKGNFKDVKDVLNSLSNDKELINFKENFNVENILMLTSQKFLKNHSKLSKDDIETLALKIKETNDVNIINKIEENKKNEVLSPNKRLKEIAKNVKKETEKPKIKLFDDQPKIDHVIEDEINDEINNYTKKIKTYALEFQDTLIVDNKKLINIEKTQNKELDKTNKSVLDLTKFNKSIQIGFWRLLLMIVIVVLSFMISMVSIRIFPKLIK